MLDVHAEQLALFGGADGVRDSGLLESALARPMNKIAYGETDLASLAAAYAFGIARNHPFVDGNKKSAFASLIVFLGLNGIDCAPATVKRDFGPAGNVARELARYALRTRQRRKQAAGVIDLLVQF